MSHENIQKYHEPSNEQGIVVSNRKKFELPEDFHLNVMIGPTGKPYTTMMAFKGVSPGEVGAALKTLFSKTYNIPEDKLDLLNSYEGNGQFLIGVKSWIPIPLKTLTGPAKRPLLENREATIEIDHIRDDPDLRLKDGPKLLPPPGSDQVIDI